MPAGQRVAALRIGRQHRDATLGQAQTAAPCPCPYTQDLTVWLLEINGDPSLCVFGERLRHVCDRKNRA